ncbi:MAG: Ig-like domain-containing protein, partial [Anaerolineales bacterium]|nr:Ig-like domain-containing protein [Anaerolineales bacterium]
NDYPASAPITIQFNQPMAPGSLKMPLLLDPSTLGEAVWSDDFTSFTFTPSKRLAGQVSTLTLHSSLRSADGKTFSQPQRWRLHHAVAPEVKAVPETAVFLQLYPTVRLQFTQPMNADSVMAALSVNPPLAFTTEWKSETNLALTFTEPFVGDEEYEVRLAKTAVSQSNMPIDNDFSRTYRLADSVAEINAQVKVNGKTAVRLRFNYHIDPGLTDTFTFSPDIAGHWQWESKETAVMFIPDAFFAPDTSYVLRFSAPLRTPDGLLLPTRASLAFTTPSIITSINPAGNRVAIDAPLQIHLAEPVDQAAVEQAVTISPATNGRFTWQNNILTFAPTDDWAYNTEYTVTIAPALYAADGTPLLQNEHVHRFVTTTKPPIQPVATFGWGENVQQLFPDGRRAVQYSVQRNSKGVIATLYPLTLPQFIQRYGTGFAGLYGGYWNYEPQSVATGGLTAVSTWPITTTHAISETMLPADTLPGLYLLDLGNGTSNDQLFVMLSDHTVAVKQGDGQLVAWVTDRDGRSQPNATIILYDRNATALNQATTNEDGIATFSQPLEGVTLVAAELNGQTTLT